MSKQASYQPQVAVSALPTLTAAQAGTIVNYQGNPYWWNGTVWVRLNHTIQIVTGVTNAFQGTTVIPITAAPTITSGTQVWSQAITVSVGTRILLKCQLFGDHSQNGKNINVAFFRDSVMIGATMISPQASGVPGAASYMDYDEAPGAGTHTYSCRVGANAAGGTWYVNQDKNGNKFGGAVANSYSLTEIL